MLRRPHTLEDARYSIELRTMLAYPYGTNAWLSNHYVLKDLVEVYPEVWSAIPATIRQQSPRVFLKRHLEGESELRVSRKLFNLFLKVGRQEISPTVAIRWLRSHYRPRS
jgi:hypothetical protein